MAIGSGLAAQLGVAEESTFGTYATPTRFLPFEKEGLKCTPKRDEIEGLTGVGSTVLRTDRWAAGEKSVKGPIELTVLTKGFGMVFKHCLGAVAISTPGGGTNTRDHTHTLADLFGKMLTIQVGKPDIGGTVRAFSYLGCKIAGWELSNSVSGFLKLSLDIEGRDEDVAQSLASASYATGVSPLHWVGGAVTIAGATVATVKGVSIKASSGVEADRFYLGSQLISQPIQEKRQDIKVDIDADFESLTHYNRLASGATAAIVATWTGPLIEGSLYNKVEVTLPACRTDGETPTVDGLKRLGQKLSFKVLDNGTDAPISLVYRTVDTAS